MVVHALIGDLARRSYTLVSLIGDARGAVTFASVGRFRVVARFTKCRRFHEVDVSPGTGVEEKSIAVFAIRPTKSHAVYKARVAAGTGELAIGHAKPRTLGGGCRMRRKSHSVHKYLILATSESFADTFQIGEARVPASFLTASHLRLLRPLSLSPCYFSRLFHHGCHGRRQCSQHHQGGKGEGY